MVNFCRGLFEVRSSVNHTLSSLIVACHQSKRSIRRLFDKNILFHKWCAYVICVFASTLQNSRESSLWSLSWLFYAIWFHGAVSLSALIMLCQAFTSAPTFSTSTTWSKMALTSVSSSTCDPLFPVCPSNGSCLFIGVSNGTRTGVVYNPRWRNRGWHHRATHPYGHHSIRANPVCLPWRWKCRALLLKRLHTCRKCLQAVLPCSLICMHVGALTLSCFGIRTTCLLSSTSASVSTAAPASLRSKSTLLR